MKPSARVERTGPGGRGDDGFTLVELVVAVMILTMGLLALAGTTGFAVRTVSLAEVRTERVAAVQSVFERLRAEDFDDLAGGSATIGRFTARWTVSDLSSTAKEVQVITRGPGYRRGTSASLMPVIDEQAQDTATYTILRP